MTDAKDPRGVTAQESPPKALESEPIAGDMEPPTIRLNDQDPLQPGTSENVPLSQLSSVDVHAEIQMSNTFVQLVLQLQITLSAPAPVEALETREWCTRRRAYHNERFLFLGSPANLGAAGRAGEIPPTALLIHSQIE